MISTDNNNQPQSQSKVRAFVRCRPPTLSEARSKPVVKLESDKISIGDKVFYFDESFDDEISQELVYQKCAKDLVSGCFDGYNSTIFAYGQTGSGKTFSMIGNLSDEEDQGIVPRALQQIFQTIHIQNLNVHRNIKNKDKSTSSSSSSKNENTTANTTTISSTTTSIDMMTSIRVCFLEIYNDECRDLLHHEIQVSEVK